MPRPRNPFAFHPLMRKGGAHSKSATSQRVRSRYDCADEAAVYLEERRSRQRVKDKEVTREDS